MNSIIVIGGGLAGLTSAIYLVHKGFRVTLIEKKRYPFHRVCGEYISNEVVPFLKSIGVDINQLDVASINQLLVSSPSGKTLETSLKMGGFGISRYVLDYYLYHVAQKKGVEFILNARVNEVKFLESHFELKLNNGQELEAPVVVGAFGKRSSLDRNLGRKFMKEKSPYLAVKHHIRTDFPENQIALHNFKDGYCGISKVENHHFNLCYLTTRQNLKEVGKIPDMEEMILHKNPYLKEVFQNSDFLFPSPKVINAISFAPKTCIENGMLMVGDSAGLITPLCGNGMAMAIHGAKIVGDVISKYLKKEELDRESLEIEYAYKWRKQFATRLQVGRSLQKLFGKEMLTDVTVGTLKHTKPIVNWLVKQTHGGHF